MSANSVKAVRVQPDLLAFEGHKMLTQERLKEVLDYNPETGIFTWKVRTSNRVNVGDVAGHLSTSRDGKRTVCIIGIGGVTYLAHRLAWLYVHGCWPPNQIDHKDRNPLNNVLSNLRCATNKQNNENVGMLSTNTSGFKGVHWAKVSSKWCALIWHCGKKIHIGLFNTAEEASAAYEAMRDKLFTHHQRKAA